MIANFAKVDSRLWRGARPDAGDASWLQANGVITVINLELLHDDDACVKVFGPGCCVHLPDWEALPQLAPKYEDKHIVAFLAAVRGAKGLTYVHCRDGQNRTGIAVAAYRLVELGEDLDLVLKDMAFFKGLWYGIDAAYITGLAAHLGDFK